MTIIDSFSFHFKWADVHEYLLTFRAFFRGEKGLQEVF